MNQRASHFVLGKTSQTYGSVYAMDYDPKQNVTKDHTASNPFRSSSLNNTEKNTFSTTNKAMFKVWENAQKAQLDPQKLSQLKGHHFHLGSYNPNDILTTHKLFYDKKVISAEASKNQEESKLKMRAHYHDFKEQKFTNYKSTYSNQYVEKEPSYKGKVTSENSQNAIVFGNHNIPMITTNAASFTPKEGGHQNNKSSVQYSSGVVLGSGKTDSMQTINQQFFNKKQLVKNSLPESTMKELRSTHFNLGNMPLQYQRQSDQINRMSSTANNPKSQLVYEIPRYQSGTWVDKEAKFCAATTNQAALPSRPVQPFQRATQNQKQGFQLGTQNTNYHSEFKRSYEEPKKGNGYELSKGPEKDNVVIGSEGNHYETEHKSNYKKFNHKDGKIDVDIKGLSKEDHFSIGGNSIENKVTVYQDEFRKDQHNKNKLFHKEN